MPGKGPRVWKDPSLDRHRGPVKRMLFETIFEIEAGRWSRPERPTKEEIIERTMQKLKEEEIISDWFDERYWNKQIQDMLTDIQRHINKEKTGKDWVEIIWDLGLYHHPSELKRAVKRVTLNSERKGAIMRAIDVLKHLGRPPKNEKEFYDAINRLGISEEHSDRFVEMIKDYTPFQQKGRKKRRG